MFKNFFVDDTLAQHKSKLAKTKQNLSIVIFKSIVEIFRRLTSWNYINQYNTLEVRQNKCNIRLSHICTY